jgi:hypothetical protein
MDTCVVELVSNASMGVYPNNTLASFANFLPEQIDFTGVWEVALSEISYPATYFNVTDGQFMLLSYKFYYYAGTPPYNGSQYYEIFTNVERIIQCERYHTC